MRQLVQIQVRVNGKTIGKPMRVMSGRFDASLILSQGPYFIISKKFNPALLALARKASSFSCSLKKGVEQLKLLLGRLPKRPFHNQPRLFACENDHEAVEKLAEELRGV